MDGPPFQYMPRELRADLPATKIGLRIGPPRLGSLSKTLPNNILEGQQPIS